MAMGITSYSRKAAKLRTILSAGKGDEGYVRPELGRIEALLSALWRNWPYMRVPVTLLALAHLILVALLPGGRNLLFGIEAVESPGYLSLFQAGDSFGFYTTRGQDGFLIYKIFTQSGKIVEGVFPNNDVLPRLRFDRWAVAGDAAARSMPALHAMISRHIIAQLPSPPLRLELYSARWKLDRDSVVYPWPGKEMQNSLNLKLLGTYNGLTRTWNSVVTKKDRQ